MSSHIVEFEDISSLSLRDATSYLKKRMINAPTLGSLSVENLCSLSIDMKDPVGIYVFGNKAGEIYYVGKTHGRSFHERMLSHLDSREPIPGSPHLAQFVSSQVKVSERLSRSEAVQNILNMNMLWVIIPQKNLKKDQHKEMIALVERRFLWKKSLDPQFNSPRVKNNCEITLKGTKRKLSLCDRMSTL
jgi:hypothetical protein